MYVDNLNIEKRSCNLLYKYKYAKGFVKREILLNAADELDIHYKENAIVSIDENMYKMSGNNNNPKIIDISIFNKTNDISKLTRVLNNLSKELYTNNKKGYTYIKNIDTNMYFELGSLGINKTFSKNVPIDKLPTYNKLKEIGEQGIYYRTSYNLNDKNGIKYHHFLTPVKAINSNENAFVRMVIKEYTNRSDLNNKFYYHQIEYLNNKKEASRPVALQSSEKQAFERTSLYKNNTINTK